jgi:NlpC/P60 family/Putative peptidoglycan binding domain/Transglycosylase SLT domain
MVSALLLPIGNEVDAIRSQFPPGEQTTAVAIMLAESGGDTNAVGENGEKGLFQLMDAPSCWRDIECNVRAAARLFRQAGWKRWTTYTSGRYKAFLNEAYSLMEQKAHGGFGSYAGKTSREPSTEKRTHANACQRLQPGRATFGILGPGSSGKLVQRAQSRLRILSDGIYGARTRASVMSIQRRRGLQVDGTIGRQTACALSLRTGRSSHLATRPGNAAVHYRTHSRILQVARSYLGIPYVRGEEDRKGMDCSGFTMVVYREAMGIQLARYSGDQPASGTRVRRPLPGDLVYWPGHVAIYYGSGYVIGARHPGVVSQIYRLYGSPTYYRMG